MDRPELPPEAVVVADLAEELIAILAQEVEKLGPGLAVDISEISTRKAALFDALAQNMRALGAVELSAEGASYFSDIDRRLAEIAKADATALKASLASQSRIIRQLAMISERRSRPPTYGPKGTMNTPSRTAGGTSFSGKKV